MRYCIKVLFYAWHLVLPFLVQNLTMQSYNDQTLLMSLTTQCDCIERTEWFSRTLWQLYVYYSLIINTLQCPGKPFCPCNVVCFQVHIWCNYNDYDFNSVLANHSVLTMQCVFRFTYGVTNFFLSSLFVMNQYGEPIVGLFSICWYLCDSPHP